MDETQEAARKAHLAHPYSWELREDWEEWRDMELAKARMPTFSFEDKWGHVGYALLAVGATLLAWESWIGWPVHMTGAGIWLWVGIRLKLTSVWFWEAYCLVNGVIGWWNWTDYLR